LTWSSGARLLQISAAHPSEGASTTEGVADRRAHIAHRGLIHSSDVAGERGTGEGVEAVAVDHRRLAESDILMIEFDFGCEPPNRRGDASGSVRVATCRRLEPALLFTPRDLSVAADTLCSWGRNAKQKHAIPLP